MTEQWDVFVSHSATDVNMAKRVADALRAAGLRVYVAVDEVDVFTSISSAVLHALQNSKVLLAYYSADYPTRHACQRESADAYLGGPSPRRRSL